MTIYETVKAAVTVRQAAEHYGLKVNRNGMTCCPFHHDRHPSLKLYEDHFYCFGCGATGDVIDFTARLFGVSTFEAVKKLAADFGIDPDKVQFAPKTLEELWNDRFTEALQMHDYIEYLADVLTVGELEERVKTVEILLKDGKVQELETRMEQMKEEQENDRTV